MSDETAKIDSDVSCSPRSGGARIVVFGTSNCFPGSSFITALGKSSVVTNFSLGASTSIHPAMRLGEVDFANFDVCLLDSAINDDAARRAGVSLDALLATLLSTAARAWSQGCTPILLIFPSRSEAQRPSLMRDMQLRIAQDHNLPFLDVFSIVKEAAARLGSFTPQDVFKDEAHLFWWFDGNLGTFVSTMAASLPRLSETIPWSYHRFDAIDLPARQFQEIAVVTRRSSAVEGAFIQLRPGQVLRVAVPPDSVVAGYAANFKHSHALMRLQGETGTAVDLRSFYDDWKSEVVLSALHLQDEVTPKEGFVSIEAMALQADIGMMVHRSHPPSKSAQPQEALIEISHLIVRRLHPEIAPSRPSPSMRVDLWRLAPESERELFLTRTRDHRSLQRQRDVAGP